MTSKEMRSLMKTIKENEPVSDYLFDSHGLKVALLAVKVSRTWENSTLDDFKYGLKLPLFDSEVLDEMKKYCK